ncbi:hypothetical protein GM658_05375 [Pseudoduganella eburnea]|uniref:Carboxypeptidase regulatory-like domain-containing protein n=1 Tax=Massilia eburnea TaxID=1776165 RepID=A0A6L6QCX6_9BURK|nr:hypothetical protein [Massilia eburnea]MTW10025.1 hypothetical protein [Massilia eburnea]
MPQVIDAAGTIARYADSVLSLSLPKLAGSTRASHRHPLKSAYVGSFTMKTIQKICAALVCALASQACLADDVPLPAVQQQGAISFITGGIGSDEAAAFRAAAAQYNLRLTLAAVSGEFFASVRVSLRDAQGNSVVEAVSDGPYLFFNVPPGKYQVTADNQGQVEMRNAVVHAKGATELYFRWKTAPEQ